MPPPEAEPTASENTPTPRGADGVIDGLAPALAEVLAPGPAEETAEAEARHVVHDVVARSLAEAHERELEHRDFQRRAPAFVAQTLLKDMWASLHLHEAPKKPTWGAMPVEPPRQPLDNRAPHAVGLKPNVTIRAAGSATQAVRSRTRPASAPARRRPRSASASRPASASKEPEKRPPPSEARTQLFRRASHDEERLKVPAFARWLDLQNRMSLKEVQATLGSLKYSRVDPVDVVVFDHVLDYLQSKNKKWADERLVMISLAPPPKPAAPPAPAPTPAVVLETTYEPPTWKTEGGARSPLFGKRPEPAEVQKAPAAPAPADQSAPETTYVFKDERPHSAPAGSRKKKRKKKRRKLKKKAGFFSLKADAERALPPLRPLDDGKAQWTSLVEDALFKPEPGVRAVEEGGASKGGDPFVPLNPLLMSREMYQTMKAGGAPFAPPPPASPLSEEEASPRKQTRGTQYLDELLLKLGVESPPYRPGSAPPIRRH